MANYLNITRSTHKTLVANTVDVLTFSSNPSRVAIMMRSPATGSAGLWVSVGAAPTVAGDDTDWLPAQVGAELVIDLGANDSVQLLSAAADAYSVRAL